MKSLIVIFLLSSTSALAGTYSDAMKICQSMSFSSSRTECTDFVLSERNSYFDEQAVATCQRASFDSDRMNCVQAIAGKIYDPYEIAECRRHSFGSDISNCLRKYGSTYYPPPPPRPPRPRPNPPGQNDQGQADYVRGQTQRWINLGLSQAPKGKSETLSFNLDPNSPLTEIRLNITKNKLQIRRAFLTTASNIVVSLSSLEGKFAISQGTAAVYQVGPRRAIRARQLVLEVESPEIFGSRSQVEVLIGVSR